MRTGITGENRLRALEFCLSLVVLEWSEAGHLIFVGGSCLYSPTFEHRLYSGNRILARRDDWQRGFD